MAYYEAAVPYSCRDVGNHLCRRRAVKDRRELRTGALADVQQRTQQIEIEVGGVPNVERASSRMGRAFRAGDTALHEVERLAHLVGEDLAGSRRTDRTRLAVEQFRFERLFDT